VTGWADFCAEPEFLGTEGERRTDFAGNQDSLTGMLKKKPA